MSDAPTLMLSQTNVRRVAMPLTSLATNTWKKSKDKPMFPKIEGSSEQSATCTPWFKIAGRGCIGIEPVKR